MDIPIEEMEKSARSAISIEPYYEDGTPLVHTSMYYDDGDELHIVLKREGDGFVFTDEGHTMMWLSYTDFEFTPERLDLMERILSQNNACFEEGRILVRFGTPSEAGYALSSITEAIIQVADLCRLDQIRRRCAGICPVTSTTRFDCVSTDAVGSHYIL